MATVGMRGEEGKGREVERKVGKRKGGKGREEIGEWRRKECGKERTEGLSLIHI